MGQNFKQWRSSKLLLFSLVFVPFVGYAQNQPQLNVKIDPRFEAISIFYFLATADTTDVKPTPSLYYKQVKAYYSHSENHPSIQWYRGLESWDGFDIPSFGLFLSHKIPFKVLTPVENHYVNDTTDFLDKLNAFSVSYHTGQFLSMQKPFYAKIARETKDTIVKSRILNYTQQFYGTNQLKHIVIFIDLLNNQGNNAIVLKNEKYKNSCLIRLAYLNSDAEKLTDSSPVQFKIHENVIAHEASHVYLRDFVSTYRLRLVKIKQLFSETAQGKKLTGKEWENELDELLVRTCVAKILASKFKEEDGRLEMQRQAKHYKVITGLYTFFGQYTNNRTKYHHIHDFYPEIMTYFERLNIQSKSTL